MKLKNSFVALASTILSGVLSTSAMAHPGHGESGWMHQHSALVIAVTVVLATVVIGGLIAARRANRSESASLRWIGARIRRK